MFESLNWPNEPTTNRPFHCTTFRSAVAVLIVFIEEVVAKDVC